MKYENTYREPNFTFHDVSINTETDPDGFMSIPDFTFHDVSINTCESRRAL